MGASWQLVPPVVELPPLVAEQPPLAVEPEQDGLVTPLQELALIAVQHGKSGPCEMVEKDLDPLVGRQAPEHPEVLLGHAGLEIPEGHEDLEEPVVLEEPQRQEEHQPQEGRQVPDKLVRKNQSHPQKSHYIPPILGEKTLPRFLKFS
jgi:hypothetical protein